jgi:transglutaminase-like putative cysteine protease
MPPIAKRFHRSMYVTLGLACACLGYAELEFLPEISGLAAVVLVLLAVAYRVEGRWSLSIRAANITGGVIAAVALVWGAYQLFRVDSLFDQLPGPSGKLPFLGPLLMILVPAKLFRPKHNGDFWALQGIGLIAVALGCALTGEPIFGVLLLGYVVSAIWSLTLFYYFRQEQAGGCRRPAVPPRAFARASRWAAGVTAVALVLFLLTPRVTDARWDFPGTTIRMQTGIDENRPVIDLNRSGTLAVNRDKVFEVHAFTKDEANPPPKLDVDPRQRWRQMVYNYYGRGKWGDRHSQGAAGQGRFDIPPVNFDPRKSVRLADLGPGQYYFEFHLGHNGAGTRQIFAEPIASRIGPSGETRNVESPRAVGGSRFPWIGSHSDDGSAPPFVARIVYDQVVLPTEEPGVSPPDQIDSAYMDQLRACASVPKLQAWSRELLRSFVDQGRLPRAVLGKWESVPIFPAWAQTALIKWSVKRGWLSPSVLDERVPPQYYEAVGRAFEAYLSQSGRFKYTMTLTRKDGAIDPIEDFVLNTRKGYCTRFATALALMLRSVGVPTRIVLGYRGFETTGDGLYEVLQCHAHSWVEAIIYRPPALAGELPWRWLTLDPTPSVEDAEDGEFSWIHWWEHTRAGVSVFFKNFIVEYDADQQERTRTAVSQSNWWAIPQSARRFAFGPGGDNWVQASLLAVAGLATLFGVRNVLRRPRRANGLATQQAAPFYGRLLDALIRALGITPRVGETAGEFAATAGDRLMTVPATHAVAGVPAAAAAAYYRVRFGDRPLTDDERREVDAGLSALEVALGGSAIINNAP